MYDIFRRGKRALIFAHPATAGKWGMDVIDKGVKNKESAGKDVYCQ